MVYSEGCLMSFSPKDALEWALIFIIAVGIGAVLGLYLPGRIVYPIFCLLVVLLITMRSKTGDLSVAAAGKFTVRLAMYIVGGVMVAVAFFT